MSRDRSITPKRDRGGRDRDRYKPDKPIFCGNFEYDATQREIERLFEKYGPLERVDLKSGFAFVYMRDRRDGDDAIRALDRKEFGYKRRRLRVEWSKGDGEVKRRELGRRNVQPTNTLFVVNFAVEETSERDLERFFEPYGSLTRVQIKRNYAFVAYKTVEEATDALKSCHLSRMNGRTISVEYVAKEANDPRGASDSRTYSRRSPSPRGRRRSPSYGARGSPSRSRSRSPYRKKAPRSPSRSASRSRDPPRKSRSLSPLKDQSMSP